MKQCDPSADPPYFVPRLSPALSMTNYFRVFLTFARNSLIRDMTFRATS